MDQAPATGYTKSTWSRLSYPYPLRHLSQDPFPAGTCFRNAFHVYSYMAGIGYNKNASTLSCTSPVLLAFSRWMRSLHPEADVQVRLAAGFGRGRRGTCTACLGGGRKGERSAWGAGHGRRA